MKIALELRDPGVMAYFFLVTLSLDFGLLFIYFSLMAYVFTLCFSFSNIVKEIARHDNNEDFRA